LKVNKAQILVAIKGFAMGCADIVPGVSGGTVALITGIYDQLLNSIQGVVKASLLLLRFRIKEFINSINFVFLIPLFCGIVFALLSMARVIHYTMEKHPEYTWSTFLGMMLASLIIVIRMVERWNIMLLTLMYLSATLAYLITMQTPFETPANPSYFFYSGFVAIIAMILPGISGSFLLHIMGKYTQVIGALKGLSEGEFYNFLIIGVPFVLGCIAGLALFSWILKLLLRCFRDMTFSVLLGLMIGSLHKLWPFRYVEIYYVKNDKIKVIKDAADYIYFEDTKTWVAFGFMLIGFLLVLTIERFSKEKPNINSHS
jgi:putative membrane protein